MHVQKVILVVSLTTLSLLSISCNYINNVRLLSGGDIDRKDFAETIPFTYTKGLVVVDALLENDTTHHQFIFDTGAFNSKVEYELAEKLNLPVKATKNNSTAAGVSRNIEVARIGKVQLGTTNFSNIGAGKLRYDEKSASPCIAEDGIIGANLIKLAHWKIDYHNQQLHFSDSPFSRPDNVEAYQVPFKKPMLSGTPEIEIEVSGRTISGVMFDVGYNGGLVLPAKFAEVFNSDSTFTVFDQSTSGIYGSSVDTITTKVLDISLGGFETKIPVEFSSIGKALLGNDLLEHFEVYINYKKKQIALIPIELPTVDFPRFFIPGILNDSLWVVNRTSPELSFHLGDTLRSVNGKKPHEMFQNHCDYILNINTLLNDEFLEVETVSGQSITLNLFD